MLGASVEHFFATLPDMLCIGTVGGHFEQLNSAWERALGFAADELTAAPFTRLVHPDDLEATRGFLRRMEQGGELRGFKIRLLHKNGGYRLLEWTGVGAPEGRFYLRAIDVTERDEEETEQRRSHKRLEHLLNSSRVILYSAKGGTEVGTTFISDNAAQVLGHEASEFLRDGFWIEHIHPDDRQHVFDGLKKLEEEGYLAFDYRFLHRDGSYRLVHDESQVYRDGKSPIYEIIGSMQDITERKQAELLIREQAEALTALSTPLIPITNQIVVMPLVGVVNEERVAQVLETLLQGIGTSRAKVAILDITGVGFVDARVADGLLQAARASQLLGAQVVITGIRPDVAQTLVMLDAQLGDIVTHGTLQAGIRFAMRVVAKTR